MTQARPDSLSMNIQASSYQVAAVPVEAHIQASVTGRWPRARPVKAVDSARLPVKALAAAILGSAEPKRRVYITELRELEAPVTCGRPRRLTLTSPGLADCPGKCNLF